MSALTYAAETGGASPRARRVARSGAGSRTKRASASAPGASSSAAPLFTSAVRRISHTAWRCALVECSGSSKLSRGKNGAEKVRKAPSMALCRRFLLLIGRMWLLLRGHCWATLILRPTVRVACRSGWCALHICSHSSHFARCASAAHNSKTDSTSEPRLYSVLVALCIKTSAQLNEGYAARLRLRVRVSERPQARRGVEFDEERSRLRVHLSLHLCRGGGGSCKGGRQRHTAPARKQSSFAIESG
jgi:hypothetical protein